MISKTLNATRKTKFTDLQINAFFYSYEYDALLMLKYCLNK